MAGASAYGRGPYGKGRYGGWPGGPGRPYGVGAYGVGPYERYGANTYIMGGATGIRFSAHMALPPATFQLHAASGIRFSAWIAGTQIDIYPAARTQIVFRVSTHMTVSWDGWTPCELGGWASPAPCEGGAWQPPAGCSDGSWTETRLETLV